MPTMLGLTTDPSPHGLNAEGNEAKGNWQTENTNVGQDLAVQAADAVSGGKEARRSRRNGESSSLSNKNKRGWTTPSRSSGATRKANPNKPRIPPSADAGNDEGGRKQNTIKARNEAAAVEMETLVWRALCDRPKSALKYMGKDVTVSNWLVFGDTEPRDAKSDPTLEDSLNQCEPYMSYRMHESQVVDIGLMATVIVYEVTLFRQAGEPDNDGKIRFETDQATVSSTWRQTAGGNWEMASMMAG